MVITDLLNLVTWGAGNYLIILLPCFVFAICSYGLWAYKTTRMIMVLRSQSRFLSSSGYKKIIKLFLMMIALLFLLIACLRPQWGVIEQKVMEEGRDLFVIFDISGSMKVIDCFGKSRLEYAKEKVKDFVLDLEQTRVGLILFSNTAFIQCPLTFDKKAFFMFLDAVDVESVSIGSTMIDKAVTLVLDTYRTIGSRKNKLALVITDGEDFSEQLDTIKTTARDERLSIFAMGVGTAKGGPIPLYNHNNDQIGYQKDTNGKIVISHLNEALLRNLTKQLGGVYVGMTADNSDIKTLIDTIHLQEKEALESAYTQEKVDRYWIFIAISFIALIFEWIL